MKIRFILISIFTLILMCSSIRKRASIFGLYGKCEDGYFACSQLELKKDSTFLHYVYYDVGGGSVKEGSWSISNDTLILNTDNQPKIKRGYLLHTKKSKTNREIQCLDRDSIPISLGTVIVNHIDTLITDIDGKSIYNQAILDLQILGLGVQKGSFSVEDVSDIDITFYVDRFICHDPNYYTSEKMILKRKVLYGYQYCHGKFASDGMKKTKMKNKVF